MNLLYFLPLAVFFCACSAEKNVSTETEVSVADTHAGFVKVKGTHFYIDGKTYYYMGANFWQGMNLASKGQGGDRARLLRELDRMQAVGISNLRILGGSEGPDSEPWRIIPSLQTSPGVYNQELLDGLDFLISEMGKRKMYAVVCLNNFWQWSGGMAQYLKWNGAGNIPYPPPQPGGSWDLIQKYTGQFYSNPGAVKQYNDFIRMILARKNPYNGLDYINDPAIMSWQLGNEPRGNNNTEAFNNWIDSTASLIKSIDPHHLVSTGCEGETPWPEASGLDFVRNHDGKNIDYLTVHIWVQNWSWYDPAGNEQSYQEAKNKMKTYLDDHIEKSKKIGKPMVVEEFGLARDRGTFDPAGTTNIKNDYYETVFNEVYKAAQEGAPVAGANFWAWAGEARPLKPYGSLWKVNDPFLGDPPHEQQGWYSVYDSDSATVKVISAYATRLSGLNK